MNHDDKFALLDRAERAMQKPAPVAADTLELTMLRAFFDSWTELHAIVGDKRNPEIRERYEKAAQALVDAAHPLRVLRKQHGN